MAKKAAPELLRAAWAAVHEANGSITEAAKFLGIPRSTLNSRLDQAVRDIGPEVTKPHVRGSKVAMKTRNEPKPAKGAVQYYLLTCAQSNTHLHKDVWKNLLALKEHYNAKLLISRFTYQKQAYGERAIKPGRSVQGPASSLGWFPPEILPYVEDKRVALAPGIVFCGEIQILPTARKPLQGFETYTGRNSTIIPHTTVALQCIPSAKAEATKFLYTTGTVTQRNYIARREGFRAEHAHSYGALLLAVRDDGDWFARQLVAGLDYSIQDLTVLAKDGVVTTGNPVEAITWGDLHPDQIDPTAFRLAFEPGGMLDTLRPKHQHLHDSLDMKRRGHHTRRDPHEMYRLYCEGRESVAGELVVTSELFSQIVRPWVRTYAIDSNHDRHLTRWLKEADHKTDHVNAITILKLSLALWEAKRDGRDLNMLEEALELLTAKGTSGVQFIHRDESLVICREAGDENNDLSVECSMHGDLGPNGLKATPTLLSKMGRRANTAHTHVAGIVDGLYTAGTLSKLDMGYNEGPSSWSHSSIVTYPNGSRSIITFWNGRWSE